MAMFRSSFQSTFFLSQSTTGCAPFFSSPASPIKKIRWRMLSVVPVVPAGQRRMGI
jgi:hypothetical protein